MIDIERRKRTFYSIFFNTLPTFKLYVRIVDVKGGIKRVLDFSPILDYLLSGKN